MTYWQQSTAEEILYKPDRDLLTLEVSPVPSTASVTLTADGYSQISGTNKIKVLKGTVVHYKLVASGFSDVEGNIIVYNTQIVTVDMNNYQYDTLTINPTPSDATVTLTASGATQSGNSITVKRGTTINYSVAKTGYDTSVGSRVTVSNTEVLNIILQEKTYKFTVTPTPSDATVTLTSSGGQTQSGNSISVNYNNEVTWTVVKTGYVTRTGSYTVTDNYELGINLELEEYVFTINPTPSDATVTLTSSGGQTQSGNSITVNYNNTVTYSVAKTNYQTKSGSVVVTAAQTLAVTLVGESKTLTISPTPSTATVTLTASGYTQSGNSITVPYGTSVNYSVSNTYYTPASGTKVVNATETMQVTLTEFPKYTITFNPVTEEGTAVTDATYSLTSVEGSSSTNSITVHEGTVVSYSIVSETAGTAKGTHTAQATTSIEIILHSDATYYAWTNGSTTVYTQCETPNETYKEYVFNAPNEIGEAITAHTDSTVTAGGVTYTRNSDLDDYTKVNSYYYEIDTTKYSSSAIGVPFTYGTYTSLVGETITIDWGDNTTTTITDGVISASNTVHTYSNSGVYDIRITSTGDFPQAQSLVSTSLCYALLTVKSVYPKAVDTSGKDITNGQYFFYDCHNITTVPQGIFKYNKVLTNLGGCFSYCTKLNVIPPDLFENNTKVTNFNSVFSGCSSLASIPAGLFDSNTEVTTFTYTFSYCTGLMTIPVGLFNSNTKVNSFMDTFNNCTALTSIPAGLFDYNTIATSFIDTFLECSSLSAVPPYLFRYNTAAYTFSHCFYGCTKLQLNVNIFCDESTEMTTRFASVTPNFKNAFNVSSFSGTQGTAPQLWNYTYKSTPTSTSCFTGHSATSLTNYNSIPTSWGGPTKLYAWDSSNTNTNYSVIYTLTEDPTDSDITVYDSSGAAIDKSSWYIPGFVGLATVGSVVRSGSSLVAKSSDELSQLSYPRNSAKDTYIN